MPKNSQYKLTYFDLRGIIEPARFIFAYAGVDYEDVRLKREEWPAKKMSTPFHMVPYLEVDGEVIGQSNAIMRFLAKRFNLAGKSDVEQARVDALADYVSDARAGFRTWMMEQDETKKAEWRNKYFNEILPDFLSVFEEHLKKNGGGHGFFVGSDPTWADFVVANFNYTGKTMNPSVLDKYPLLNEHIERVNNLKGIKEWIAKRPNTPF